MDRRKLLSLASLGAATGAASLLSGGALAAAEFAPRGMDGRLTRLAELDVEGRHDFTFAFVSMHRNRVRAMANEALDRLLEREGIDPLAPMGMRTLLKLVDNEPSIAMPAQTWAASQRLTWKNLQDHFYANADALLAEMDAADRSGPGSVELIANAQLPEHVCHQIHLQPGGYVGDPFAGHMYHYATNSFYGGGRGPNDQDQQHRAAAAKIPVPADGKVRRILDYGCGMGQFTVALKERFPDAEVWGLDIGGPMVRYGHLRAAKLGVDVNFVQRLAEDNGFPDGYFDIVTSYIAHHEMPADVTKQVIAEAQRTSRPGAVYYPVDFRSVGDELYPRLQLALWLDHRWNNERWSLEFQTFNFADEIEARGFTRVKDAQPVVRGFGVRHFIRV